MPVDEKFREMITGDPKEKPYDTNSFAAPENPVLDQFGGVKLAQNDEEYLLLELLPAVAKIYLTNKRKAEYEKTHAKVEDVKKAALADVTGPVFCAPMGGTVLSVKVKAGDTVKQGQNVIVYEAMKMENNLASDMAGVVKQVLVSDGDVMSTGQPLIEFEGGATGNAAPAAAKTSGTVYKVEPVKGFDYMKAVHPIEGGTGKVGKTPDVVTEEIHVAAGSTVNVIGPDGKEIRIICDK